MISFSDITSGNATRILNLAKNLSNEFDIEIIFDGNKYSYIPRQFKNLKINFTPYLHNLYATLSYGIFYKMIRYMKNYDIIHCFKPLPSSFIPSFFISKMKNVRLIVDWDDWEGKGGFAEFDPFFLRDFLNWFQFFSLKKADAVITVTSSLKNIAKKFNQKVYLIPNGADIELFTPAHEGKNIRDKFNCPLVAYIGLLYKSCDLDIVIKAMRYVTNEINAKLIVVGDGPRKKEFIELAEKYKLKRDVVFVGYKPRELIPEFIGAADVVVLPMKDNLANRSRSPVKLCEYMACGKAVVASNVGIAKEVINNYHNGCLAPNEPRKFGEIIISLLQNEGLRKKIGKNARKTAEEKFDWRIISKKLENIYNELAHG